MYVSIAGRRERASTEADVLGVFGEEEVAGIKEGSEGDGEGEGEGE